MMDLIDLSEISKSFSAKPTKEKVETVDNNANILPGDVVQEIRSKSKIFLILFNSFICWFFKNDRTFKL